MWLSFRGLVIPVEIHVSICYFFFSMWMISFNISCGSAGDEFFQLLYVWKSCLFFFILERYFCWYSLISWQDCFLFLFEKVLNLQKNYKRQYRSFFVPFAHFPLLLTSYIALAKLAKLRSLHRHKTISSATAIVDTLSIFPLMSFSCSRIQSNIPHCI